MCGFGPSTKTVTILLIKTPPTRKRDKKKIKLNLFKTGELKRKIEDKKKKSKMTHGIRGICVCGCRPVTESVFPFFFVFVVAVVVVVVAVEEDARDQSN